MSFMVKLPEERQREIIGATMLALTIFLFVALVSDEYQGSIKRPLDGMAEVYNLCGKPGAVVAGVLYVMLGYASHVLYFLTCVWALMLFRHRSLDRIPSRMAGMLVLTGSVAGLLHLDLAGISEEGMPGGMFGAFVSNLLRPTFGQIGSNVIGITLAVVGILLATEFLLLHACRALYVVAGQALRGAIALYELARVHWSQRLERVRERRWPSEKRVRRLPGGKTPKEDDARGKRLDREPETARRDLSRIRIRPDPTAESPFDAVPDEPNETPVYAEDPPRPEKKPETDDTAPFRPPPAVSLALKKARPRRKTMPEDELPPGYEYPRRYTKPPLDLLDHPAPSIAGEGLTEMLRQTSLLLEQALDNHGIEARVTEVTRGPTITRYELEPAPGIKVSKFQSLADDLALALKAQGVRVEAPIPGKGRIGIELPNSERQPVVLRELLESRRFKTQKGRLVIAMGKDIAGDVVTADLAAMPHLLIAGATGAGKSVCTKALLASLLFNHTPDTLQVVLIDPKMVEFSFFNDIPHLITPVVVDPKQAATSLNWLVAEMEERYRLFARLRVRNIEGYNQSVENGEIEMPGVDGEAGESVDVVRKLPYIVCVIDELSDLMMMVRAEVEDAIMRLAQLARAVGIHLILATQRPSVNVLTGVIKANFPVRVAFQVSSRVDSRCILDSMGAERLIGEGDMLYLPAGKASPVRIQGAFVSDDEMNALVSYLKTQAPPQYRDEVQNFGRGDEALDEFDDEDDDLFEEAVQVVLDTGQASISMVQRRLRVGYTRAARLIDMMEQRGIVGPHVGSKAREILVDRATVLD